MPTSPLDLTGVASYEMFLRGTLRQDRRLSRLRAHRRLQDRPQSVTRRRDSRRRTARWRSRSIATCTNSSSRDRRRQEEERGRGARAVRSGAVRCREERSRLDSWTNSPTKTSSTIVSRSSGGDSDRRIEGSDYQRIASGSAGVRPRSRIAVLYVVGTIASGKGGFDPVNGSVVGFGVDRRTDPEDTRRQLDQGDRAAHRQPGRIVGGVGRDLARAGDHARLDNPSRPIVDVDVGSRGVRRLLHRDARPMRSSRSRERSPARSASLAERS